MTDQQILMTDPIPLCWAEPSELAWHPASESDPKGFLTLKGELVIEPPFIVHHFGELLVPPIIDVGSVRISVSGEVIPGAAQRGCPLYLRCSMPDLMR